MKLYIWEDVLTDYTSGLAIALAPDLEIALRTFDIGKDGLFEVADKLGAPTKVIDCTTRKTPYAVYVYGGG